MRRDVLLYTLYAQRCRGWLTPLLSIWSWFTFRLSKQLDFCVMTHPAAAAVTAQHRYPAILEAYYDAIGLPTVLPDWALGFQASKQRYASTAEIIDTVKNYTVRQRRLFMFSLDGFSQDFLARCTTPRTRHVLYSTCLCLLRWCAGG